MRSAVGIEHSIQKPTGNHASRSIAAATTDSHGRYEIPAPERSFFQGLYTSYHLQPHKSGLAFSPVSWNGEGPRPPLAMVSAHDTTEGQLREIRLMLGYAECLQVPIAQAATLLPFYRLLLSDAIRLGAESDDPGLLRMVCGSISSVGRDDSQATVGAVSTLIPGSSDPREKLIFNRLEPRCLAITEPVRPTIRRVVHPNPSATAPASTAPADPSK